MNERLADSAILRLAKIAALGMFGVRAAAQKGDARIRQGRADEHPQMLALEHMGEDQPLPVAVEVVFGAPRSRGDASAALLSAVAPEASFWVGMAAVLLATLVVGAYSFLAWRREGR